MTGATVLVATRFWPSTAQGWAPIATFVLVAGGLLIARRQLQQAITTRHGALWADLSRRWSEPLLEESRRVASEQGGQKLRAFLEAHHQLNDDTFYILLRGPDFFEDLAVLEKVGAISFEMVKQSLGETVVDEWDMWASAVLFLRKTETGEDPLIYGAWELLAERMRRSLDR